MMSAAMTTTTTTTTTATMTQANAPDGQGLAKPQAGDATARLTVAHLFGFLIGRRDSILVAARDPATPVVGLLLVFAAALAREYDGEDLRREPWHLLIPLGASLALSFVLFLIVRRWGETGRLFWGEYRSFLGLFWLTAPLALLYGIPYERFLSPLNAVQANLWTLAIVATWRVALMTRVVSAFTGRSAIASLFLVFVMADLLAAALMVIVPVPTLQVMGGIRLTEAEQRLQTTSFIVAALALLTSPIWLISAIVAWFRPGGEVAPALARTTGPTPKGVLTFAAATVAVWFIFIPFTQREQRLRSDAERLLLRGDIAKGLAEMSRHERDDYPPAWDPPPRIGWPEPEQPAVMDVIKVLATEPAGPWVREIYIDKFERRWLDLRVYWDEETLPKFDALLDALPEGPELKKKHGDFIGLMPSTTTQPAPARSRAPATTQSGAP
jgi:hypothetical protein